MRTKLPPMKALMTFEAVARHGDRALAARELNVTPGAVAKQLRQLEDWLMVTLLDEGELTGAGRTLAQSLSAGIDMISAGVAELRPARAADEVALLAPATLALHWLIPRLPHLGAAAEGRILVRPTHTREDWQVMAHDVVLRRDSWVPPGYRAESLGHERLTAAVAPSLAGPPDEVPGEFLRRLPQLRAETRPGDTERWLRAAGADHSLGHPTRSFGHLYIAYEAALAGQGWVLAPTLAVAEDAARGRLVMPFPEISIEGPPLTLLWRAGRAAQVRTDPIRSWLRAELRGEAARG